MELSSILLNVKFQQNGNIAGNLRTGTGSGIGAIDILGLSSPFQVRTFLLFHNEAGISAFSLLKEGRYNEFQQLARESTWAGETPKEELSGEFAFVSLVDRLTALQDTVHTDLPGKKRSKASRRRSAD